jgi:mannose-6-phosphate isomerase-like protein (cupin superfamily)
MFDKSDPRAGLGRAPTTAPGAATDAAIAAAHYAEFDGEPSHVSTTGSPTWITRGQNFIVTYSRLSAGDELRRPAGQDEYVAILHQDDAMVTVHALGGQATAKGQSLVVVPSGESVIRADQPTDVVRVFDIRTADLAAQAANAADYLQHHPRVAALEEWPEPVDGNKVRVYPLDGIAPESGRFGRIFRTRTLMINYMYPTEGPRDISKLSPHHHEDFEQGSLAVRGEFTHHIRTPWTPDMNQWREDEHTAVGSPSLAIIPPPTVHTTRATGAGTNILIDIFSPPREDFSDQPGWVLNADEYPRK